MSLGQCVVQWEGAFGVLVSVCGGDPVYCSVCMGAVNVLFSVHGGHSMYCSVGGGVQCMLGGIQCDVDWFDLVQPTSSHSYYGVLSAMALSCSEDTTCIYFKHVGYISQQKTSMNVLKIC